MKMNDASRPYIEKVTADTREYVQALLDENQRLHQQLADLQADRERTTQMLEQAIEERRAFSARYVEVEQQNTNLANLYVASYQLHGTLDRERVLTAIKEIVINLIGSEELAIWEVDRDFGALVLIESFGIDRGRWAALPLDAPGVIGLVASTGETYTGHNTKVHVAGREEPLVACIPLKLDGEVIAVIALFSLLAQKERLEAIDYELFDLLGSHGASALYCTRASSAVEALQ